MLLIYPPLAKDCEPPAGIALLAGALRASNISSTLLDANHEAFVHILENHPTAADTWSRRAMKNISRNLAALRSEWTYTSPSKYRRAVADLNRIVEMSGRATRLNLSLSNYHDDALSPVRSEDLLHTAEHPERNIFYAYYTERFRPLITRKAPKHIGVSINYLSQALPAFAMIGFLKKEYPEIPIIAGGGLITSWMRSGSWSDPFSGLIDHCIDGPGVAPLLSLLGAEECHDHPMPDYSQLPTQFYLSPGFILPYAASSGCYWNRCSFCPETAEQNPYSSVPARTAARAIDELAMLHKPSLVHLLDNAVSPALMKEMISTPPTVPWYGFARISSHLADPEFCRALRKSGCVMIKLGLESGSQEVLDNMCKGIDLRVVEKALTSLHLAGIATYVYLLFGTPAETPEDARKTMEFVIRHHQKITFLNLAIFNLPVCSKETSGLQIQNFYEGDLSLYTDFIHPQGWNRKQVRQFLSAEFKKHPAIAEIIHRDPPFFTSNHAPFFRMGSTSTEPIPTMTKPHIEVRF